MMMTLLAIVAWLAATVVALAALYRAVFAVAYLVRRDPAEGLADPAVPPRFAVLIPAHDEELLIESVLRSVRAADYPQDRIDIHVIADNCRDTTADKVRAAGEHVHERTDAGNPGKGQALDWCLGRLDLDAYDAVALFDADVVIDPGFFSAMARELEAGRTCLQGYYGIANPGESVMTRLLTTTYVMKNELLNGGKACLGFPITLMGTGMVFRASVLARTGWQAMSIGEDLEQTFCLLDHDEKVHFVVGAVAHAQEAVSLRQGYTQRQRWASGRRALNARARRAIARGLREGDLHRADVGIDILMPPYSKHINWSVLAGLVSLAAAPATLGPLVLVGVTFGYQVLEVLAALVLMKADAKFVSSLVFAPIFLAWKAAIDLLAVVNFRGDAWTRTERQPHTREHAEDHAPGDAACAKSGGES